MFPPTAPIEGTWEHVGVAVEAVGLPKRQPAAWVNAVRTPVPLGVLESKIPSPVTLATPAAPAGFRAEYGATPSCTVAAPELSVLPQTLALVAANRLAQYCPAAVIPA